jgi:hypothetical protein
MLLCGYLCDCRHSLHIADIHCSNELIIAGCYCYRHKKDLDVFDLPHLMGQIKHLSSKLHGDDPTL